MTVLVTGAAGFIGFHVAEALLARGEAVLGVDNFNPYYEVALKEARLACLARHRDFRCLRLDIADHEGFQAALGEERTPYVVHLAAQPGVRYSIDHPFEYVNANLTGHMTILEHCRRQSDFRHLVFASSSSVYGGKAELPFRETDRVDRPVSLYAATKKADELMSHAYADLYGLAQTGLRFFTVYGPWGRPDMAVWSFTEAIFEDRPIRVFNHGDMRRDFTYVGDIVAGVLAALDQPPGTGAEPPYRIYNIGNNRSEALLHMIEVLEKAIGRTAQKQFLAMQPGDVKDTYADITAIESDLGYRPTTPIEEGLPRFVAWYRDYRGI